MPRLSMAVHGLAFVSEQLLQTTGFDLATGSQVGLPPTLDTGSVRGWGRSFGQSGWHHVAIPTPVALDGELYLEEVLVLYMGGGVTLAETHLWAGDSFRWAGPPAVAGGANWLYRPRDPDGGRHPFNAGLPRPFCAHPRPTAGAPRPPPRMPAPPPPPAPLVIRALDRDECLAVLARHAVGRIAYAFHDRVDIEPIHFVYAGDFLYGRTSEGAKLQAIAHNRWVAFEVDEVRGTFDWTSVVVRGAFYRLDPAAAAPREREEAARAVALLDAVVPHTLAPGDPAPFRTVLFRVHVDEVTGREAARPA